eukprot:TRINITY_DN16421_c0_g1_i1.p1 TRINITY_DN16421_c0_g1~~TRINITY_DN16421_c0_g1_i1.p1  ORF type:complete len:447 (+),score=102.36 TRINITY_DN16421_c0_g1_i1:157-1497(+)
MQQQQQHRTTLPVTIVSRNVERSYASSPSSWYPDDEDEDGSYFERETPELNVSLQKRDEVVIGLASHRLYRLPGFAITQLASRNPQLQELSLYSNHLQSLPGEIEQLVNLKAFFLHNNQLKTLPPQISKLRKLQNLTLHGNMLKTLPEEIGLLSNLKRLIISYNKLEQLPDAFCRLHSLEELFLSSNDLSHLPNEIGRLTALRELVVRNNRLEQLPSSIGQLRSLCWADFNNNQIASLPNSITLLTSLQRLHLSNNSISYLPKSIGNLSSLVWLYLHNNTLRHLPSEISQLATLRELSLFGNQLPAIPITITQLTNLQWLSIEDNPLRPRETDGAWYNCGNTLLEKCCIVITHLRQNDDEVGLLGDINLIPDDLKQKLEDEKRQCLCGRFFYESGRVIGQCRNHSTPLLPLEGVYCSLECAETESRELTSVVNNSFFKLRAKQRKC